MNYNDTTAPDETLHLPRILCLHGGGSNAEVFHTQMRKIRAKLDTYFRLVYVDGPFICAAGPGVGMVYQHLSPFRRWLRWLPEHPEIDGETAVNEIDDTIAQAVREDDLRGATGDCVGLFGFSQGAMVCASLLLRQQKGQHRGTPLAEFNFKFAVICAGRAPLVRFGKGGGSDNEDGEDGDPSKYHLGDPADRTTVFTNWPSRDDPPEVRIEYMLHIPTVHVHGSKDAGLSLHRKLMDLYCSPGSTELVQWCGDHRLPLKSDDVEAVVEEIINVARKTGSIPVDQTG
ncbi:Serine hydrolase FSH [Ascosphaera apis ARSEF 7405]|uniref:Serine hydrolase FSH n=1 Tax=Ascosphaera apis ARSEF 7405 TaxID=392613 RepID=A0A167X1W1_9EURO|nr:Serine hydrolase FSH [Ascosphaera apis ARSEF 7405]